jgi:hypothetical protein
MSASEHHGADHRNDGEHDEHRGVQLEHRLVLGDGLCKR